MTQEQIEQKKQLLKQKLEEANALRDELQAAGALALNEDELDKVAGGWNPPEHPGKWDEPEPPEIPYPGPPHSY